MEAQVMNYMLLNTSTPVVLLDEHGTGNAENNHTIEGEVFGLQTSSVTHEQEMVLKNLDFWINGVINHVIVFLGLICNILAIITLKHKTMRSSTNHYLTVLAVWDTVVLFTTYLLIVLPALPKADHYRNWCYAYIAAYFYPVGLVAQTATIWLTVSFTVERYIAVCHPLKAASMCTITRAKIVITFVSLIATLYNIPRWFDYRPQWKLDLHTNQSIPIPAQTEFGKNETYLKIYYSWLYLPVMCIIPLLVLSVLNTCLIQSVRKSLKQRKNMNVKESRENNVTIMLVSVVIVFIICQVPALAYNLAYAVNNKYVQTSYGYRVLSHVRNFMVNLNSAINFLLYCALGQKFRRIFTSTFCCCCKKKQRYTAMRGSSHKTTIKMASMKGFSMAIPQSRAPLRNKNGVAVPVSFSQFITKSNSNSCGGSECSTAALLAYGAVNTEEKTYVIPKATHEVHDSKPDDNWEKTNDNMNVDCEDLNIPSGDSPNCNVVPSNDSTKASLGN